MSSVRNDRAKVIELLFSKPLVELSTSWTDQNNIVRDDYIVVRSAPPVIVTAIVQNLVMVSLCKDGLLIPLS